MDPIDAFTRARFKDAQIGERFSRLRALHRKASDAMWAGWLTSSFSDDEIELMRRFSLLCPYDESLIAGARTGEPQLHSVVPGASEPVHWVAR